MRKKQGDWGGKREVAMERRRAHNNVSMAAVGGVNFLLSILFRSLTCLVYVIYFPGPNFTSGFIEKPLVIPQANFFAGILAQQSEQRRVQVGNPKIRLVILRRDLACTESKA